MTTFEDLGFKPEILKALSELGFETPTPIQEQTAKVLIETDQDVVGLAQTGTGKTAAFGLPIIHDVEPEITHIQSLILTPTRELCIQVSKDLEKYAKYLRGIKVLAVYGGTDIKAQIKKLTENPHILVATPGRLLDLINRGRVDLSELGILVLDEADEMLNMGFKDDIEEILGRTPENRRTLMFSATMPKEVSAIAKNYLYNPLEVTIGKKNESTNTVFHHYYVTTSSNRFNALRRIVDAHPDIYGMVFCRTRAETKEVAERLVNHGYNADALHGDLSQAQRDLVMDKFRKKNLQLLVATDVAARGIDIYNLTHVINYNLPDDAENYTHRSGRTGRAGKEGISIAIIHSREFNKLHEIERVIKKTFVQQMIPNGLEICQSQLMHYFNKISELKADKEGVSKFMDEAMERLGGLSKEELIEKMVAYEFQHLLNDYKNAPDLNIEPPKKEQRRRNDGDSQGGRQDRWERGGDNNKGRNRQRDNRGDDGGNWEQVSVNIGNNRRVSPPQIIAIINKALGNRRGQIGRIKINQSNSLVELRAQDTSAVLQVGSVKFDGEEVRFAKA
ncbi:MAG: DEAD/DEAH box helicase [Bacteroidetes bacterium]|nr:DEAD/DEAH box helicase [Bacteroidota bacterium]